MLTNAIRLDLCVWAVCWGGGGVHVCTLHTQQGWYEGKEKEGRDGRFHGRYCNPHMHNFFEHLNNHLPGLQLASQCLAAPRCPLQLVIHLLQLGLYQQELLCSR